jgi:tetratricopeptide (TPR) repeat protein
MFLFAALALPHLGDHLFWDDEANTAIYARNFLHTGRITAWDGTNLMSYAHGGALGEDLGAELRVPTLPAYLVAASMALFGETTFAGRLPFVLAGTASVGLLGLWMRRHLGRRFPCYLPAMLLAVSPAMLLYARNCRYYALGVMFSLLVWTFWAPGAARAGRLGEAWGDRRTLLRFAAAAVALLLLLWTHYLNAAVLVATLPLFFLDRRYRQQRQYVLLAVLVGTMAFYGFWLLATANPWAAQYDSGSAAENSLTRFAVNLGWFLRDLGSHEFFAWPLVAAPLVVFGISRLPATAAVVRRARRAQPLVLRCGTLVAVVLASVVFVTLVLPADMGKGPLAEMRYIVPLVAVGCAVGGLAAVVLGRLFRPLGVLLFLLLATTNWLHLGFLLPRFDRTDACWPPTLCRYLDELGHPYESGNEALVGLLGQLPPGTCVRVVPTFMTYPPMFYVPGLHYCDQLTEKKPIRADLRRELPNYLFVERAKPEVIIVPPPLLRETFEELNRRYGEGAYRLQKTLAAHFNYTTKPEIPMHWFRPPTDPQRYPGMLVFVAAGSSVAKHPALAAQAADIERGSEAFYRVAFQLTEEGQREKAVDFYEATLQLNPRHVDAHVNLGVTLEALGKADEAARQYLAALAIQPDSAVAHFNLANLFVEQMEWESAEAHYRAALAAKPAYPQAHVNLANLLLRQGKTAEARRHLHAALDSLAADAPLGLMVRRLLRQLE